MVKTVIVVIVLLIAGGGGFFLYKNFQATKPKSSPEATPQNVILPTSTPTTKEVSQDACTVLQNGSADVPPLYKEGITWEQPTMTEYEVPLAEASQRMRGCLIKSSTVNLDISDLVRDNYTKELQIRNWEIESAGDVPGAGFITWRKARDYFVLRVTSVGSDLNTKTLSFFYVQ